MRLVSPSSSANLLSASNPSSPGRTESRNCPPSPSPPIIRGNNPPSILRGENQPNGRPNRPPLPRHLRGLQRLSVAVQELPIWRRKEREGGEDCPPIIREDGSQPNRPNLPHHLRGLQRLSVAVQELPIWRRRERGEGEERTEKNLLEGEIPKLCIHYRLPRLQLFFRCLELRTGVILIGAVHLAISSLVLLFLLLLLISGQVRDQVNESTAKKHIFRKGDNSRAVAEMMAGVVMASLFHLLAVNIACAGALIHGVRKGHLLFLDPWLVLSSLFLTLLLTFLILSMGGFCYGASDVLFCLATVAFTIYLILTVASYRAVLVETTCPQR